jgi:hypothetical protein
VWWAAFVYTLAKGRVTPDVEHWVLWELPFGRALAYQHCCLRANGQWTVPLGKPLKERLAEATIVAERIAKADNEEGGEGFDDLL